MDEKKIKFLKGESFRIVKKKESEEKAQKSQVFTHDNSNFMIQTEKKEFYAAYDPGNIGATGLLFWKDFFLQELSIFVRFEDMEFLT